MSQNNKEAGIILDDINNENIQTGGNHMTEEEFDEMINRFENRGALKQAIESARNALAMGLSVEQVEKITRLPAEQIEELQKEVTVQA